MEELSRNLPSGLETPWDFNANQKVGDHMYAYSNMWEVTMGGPVVGSLSIDGRIISADFFGGPMLVDEQFLYVPIFSRGFFRAGFRLAKVNISSLRIELIGKMQSLICLDRIAADVIYYYADLEKRVSRTLKIK